MTEQRLFYLHVSPTHIRLHFSEGKLRATENHAHVKFVACSFNMQRRQSIFPLEDSTSSC